MRYQLVNRDQCDVSTAASWVDVDPSPAVSTTLNSLFPHSSYNVVVTASNDVGTSQIMETTGTTGEMSKSISELVRVK